MFEKNQNKNIIIAQISPISTGIRGKNDVCRSDNQIIWKIRASTLLCFLDTIFLRMCIIKLFCHNYQMKSLSRDTLKLCVPPCSKSTNDKGDQSCCHCKANVPYTNEKLSLCCLIGASTLNLNNCQIFLLAPTSGANESCYPSTSLLAQPSVYKLNMSMNACVKQ